MAVKVRNVANAKKAKLWNEKDDVALTELLRNKIKEMNVALRECETPYERSRLKKRKEHYKDMLHKVESGSYNGDIIFNELKAAAALTQEQTLSTRAYASVQGGKTYNNSYNAMDFDYETAFRKKRYYGFVLPLILLILSALLLASFVVGFILPEKTLSSIKKATNIDLSVFIMYNLGEAGEDGMKTNDIQIENTGEWPKGETDGLVVLEDGVAYTDDDGKAPEKVWLGKDCGYELLYISSADIVKAWFKTKMLKKTKLDFIEDLKFFQGESVYEQIFLSGTKSDDIVIKKNAEGNYDVGVIYNHIGVYGTIIFTIVGFLMGIVLFVLNFIRLFTYTSRRIHGTTLFAFFMCAFAAFAPAFAACEGTLLGTSLSGYLKGLNGVKQFSKLTTVTVGISITYLIPVVVCAIMLILPFIFKNRYKKLPTRIPKGNPIHDPFNRKKPQAKQ